MSRGGATSKDNREHKGGYPEPLKLGDAEKPAALAGIGHNNPPAPITPPRRRRRIVFKEDLERIWGIRANASTLWRWEKQGRFPKHFMCGNRNAWYDDVIDAHVECMGAETTEVA